MDSKRISDKFFWNNSALKKKIVLVTGSCGFIGRNLLEQLPKKNISVIGSYYRKKNLNFGKLLDTFYSNI